ARSTTCRATIGPVQVEAGSVARVHVFAWDCGDRIGYVPQAAQDDCYWLADWSFVGPTNVPLGRVIDARVVAKKGAGTLAYQWSSSAPELGGFSAPGAPQTALRCLAAGENLPFQVSISDGVCEQLVTQVVSCRSQ
ncbi:MAG TPA: hypothetical protein VEX18_01705, partial [Polyangiaceae bacterium]|nr:hypothetical protein [Polyangiaceae bacterium]